MLRRFRHGDRQSVHGRPHDAWQAGLRAFAGTDRVVLYDVPVSQRPVVEAGRLRPRGSSAWERFLEEREVLDDGGLAIILSLRGLDDEEARLAVDWGCTYANAFLLVEPAASDCDLTATGGAWRRRLEAAVATDEAAESRVAGTVRLRGSVLDGLLRAAFGVWVHWPAPPPGGAVERVSLPVKASSASLIELLYEELTRRAAQTAFDHELVRLHLHEGELLRGPVPRARSVFRTRLGMPVLLDVFAPDRGLRKLVDRGRLVVAASVPGSRVLYGGGRPVPLSVSDEEFAKLTVL